MQFSFEICCRWKQVTARAHISLRARYRQCSPITLLFSGEMRIALRTPRYSMLHHVRAVSNIRTVAFDADDSLHVIMLWSSCDLIVFQYNYHICYKTCYNYLCFFSLFSRGDTSGACPTRGGRCI